MTYLEIINKVMRRIREPIVGSVAENAYSLMVGEFVNDAKRVVEDAWAWRALTDSVPVVTASGTHSYNLADFNCTGSGAAPRENARLYIDPQSSSPLIRVSSAGEEALLDLASPTYNAQEFQRMVNASNTDKPRAARFGVNDSAADGESNLLVTFDPIPNGVYTIDVFVVNPQNDLSDEDEVLLVPSFPVVQLAYLYLLYERGEEIGESLSLTATKADKALADAISIESSFTSELIFRPN
jgi:hypothetical protein